MSKTEGWLFQGALLSGMISLAAVMFDSLPVAYLFMAGMFVLIMAGMVVGIFKKS